MLLAKVCRGGFSPTLTSLAKAPVVPNPFITRIQATRLMSNEGRTAFTRSSRTKRTIGEFVASPPTSTAINVGQGLLAGSAVIGIGSLCYYGLGLSAKPGIIDQASLWPQYVKDRVKDTYMYLGTTVVVSAASAVSCLRSRAVMNLLMHRGLGAFVLTTAALIGSAHIAYRIPYTEGFGAKQLAWLTHAAITGAVIAPLYLLGGPIVLRAAWSTAGIVGALSTIAICAPSEKFLGMAGPLAVGLGFVFASSVAGFFLPPTTNLGLSLYSISIYGGLLLFSLMLLYDTQRVIKGAEMHPYRHPVRYDPINSALHLYMDIINIFVRMAMLSGNNRK